ncbi:unnamed protein product, partial [Mesorhabditis spiculigera]
MRFVPLVALLFAQTLGRQRRVIFGVPLARGELPYLTSIVARFPHHNAGEGTLCGGSLIASNIVLTAAHCLLNEETNTRATSLNVTINDFVLDQPDKGEIAVPASHFDIHPQYYEAFESAYDIGIIFLAKSVPICEGENPIKKKPFQIARLPFNVTTGWPLMSDSGLESSACYHSGWGVTKS